MITSEKVKIFASWKGDGDMFARSGSRSDKEVINDAEWSLIERMLEDQVVIKRNLGSAERVANAKERFRRHCENEEVIEHIGKLAEKLMRSQKFS